MPNRYFHREFLAKPDDDSSSAAVMARVSKTESDWVSASLVLTNDHENLFLSFSAFKEEEVDEMVRRARNLAIVVSDFAKALEAEAKDVKKEMKKNTT